MTLEFPASTAPFTMSAPASIIQNADQAQRGVARRELSSIAEAK